MSDINIEMAAMLKYRECNEKDRENIKNFIFDMIYNEVRQIDWELDKEKFNDVKRSLNNIRYTASESIKNNNSLIKKLWI